MGASAPDKVGEEEEGTMTAISVEGPEAVAGKRWKRAECLEGF